MGKSFIWVGTLQTRMFKDYYCVLLIMDKLIVGTLQTLKEYYWVIKHNGLNCWTTKMDTKMDTKNYLEGSGLSGINSRDVVVLGKDFI